ncbi:glycosyltransferase family A protein [Clostridium perfringens]|uniref:glycosyltransferase family A protein n=1 Tax=Clostridium perfringens TaxID=1502 RepID=UPI0010F34B71|nr:glycosyltransferase family A protein [Clostridium perfringens]MDU2661245.1 glycosyltransferase family A protein [Clostridioides difficile]MDB2046939.1 glycosyltransferase family A protein [Clostridium perfringens]MDB2057986.1 glycosyltransferase family A protein [Clostridium perfringens]MDK0612329.1 glycosyltransferase family A protein [Clostridium perfringens]MDK0644890.1 glycosyltransferase family A protein [Clostridium perfringens]
MSLITVITPTYNRKDKLDVLFKSLLKQTSKNFEWLIIDDGSTDQTEEYLNKIKSTCDFTIRYIKKKNGGKHTALNVGVKEIKTILTIIVDSDDYLVFNAIEMIEFYYKKYKEVSEIGVFSFSKINNNKLLVKLPKEEFIESYIKFRIKENRPGDMAEVFYTDILKEFSFPEFTNEKFLSEDVVWIQIGKKYKYLFLDKPIYTCEYLVGGLTCNDKPMKFESPLGSMLRGKILMSKECGLKVRIKGAIIYNCYLNEVSGELPEILSLNSIDEKILVFITKLLGVYFNKKWKRKR